MKTSSRFFTTTLTLSACAFVAVLAAVNVLATCTPPPAGIVGWWKGDGTAVDAVAGNNGVLVNIGYTNGVAGQAFACDPESYPYGTYCGVQIPDSPAYVLTNAMTIEGWIRPRGDGYNIFWRGDNRPGLDPYLLSMQGSHQLAFYITDENGNNDIVSTTIPYGVWVHVAATFDAGGGMLRLYTNGVLAAQKVTTVRPFGNLIAGDSPGVGIGNVNDGGNNFPFLGDIDEIALYNRALAPAEIAAVYNAGSAGKCTSTPVPATGPAIFSFTPAVGAAGATVTIAGTNFSSIAANNLVRFGSLPATVLAATTTSLTVIVPARAISGPLTATVNGATAYAPTLFVVTYPNVASRVIAWGDNTYGQTNIPAGLNNVIAIATGACSDHNLALKNDGTLVAWGENNQGQATVPAGLNNVVAVAAGGYHNLVLKNDGSVSAWGFNSYWAGYAGQAIVPAALTNAVAVAAGWYHSLAVTTDGHVIAWGYDGTGQTDVPAGLSNVVAIAGAPSYSLALKVDGTVATWGINYQSSGGNNYAISMTPPPGLTNVIAIAAGYFHAVALKADGTVVAWGDNTYGQTNVPSGLNNVVAIAAGSYHTLAVKADGTVVDWGIPYPWVLNEPAGLTNAVAVSAGYFHSVVLMNDASSSPPVITGQPANQTVASGTTATFTVTATGTQPLSYQWNFNGTNISGATNSSLTLNNVSSAQAGNYFVLVSNPVGSATSFNAVLTVFASPTCAPPPAGIVSWWPGAGNANDVLGGNNGSLVGGVGYASGEVGQGFVMNGNAELVTAGTATNLQLQDFTIEAWVKRASTALVSYGTAGNGMIFGFGYGGYGLYLDPSGRPALSRIGIDETKPNVTITDMGLHHLAVAKSGSTVVFYVDGIAYSAPAYNPGFVFSTVAAIGGRGDNLDNSFLGLIDEVAVYNRALAANEIAAIYNAGSAGKCVASNPPSCTPPAVGIVSWWPGAGNANDVTGGNSGTWAGYGTLNTYAPGVVGQAMVFDGTHRDRVYLGNPANLQLQNFTIEAWVKRASATVVSLDENFADGSIAGPGGYVFGYGAGGYALVVFDDGSVGLTQNSVNDTRVPPVLTDTSWHHVAVAKAGTAVSFFVDGVQQPTPSLNPYTNVFNFTTPVAIASRGDGGGNTFYGLIDELAVYNRALSSNEVSAIYNASSAGKCVASATNTCVAPPSGIAGWWKGEGNGADSVNGQTGILENGLTFAGGEVGQAFLFNDTNADLRIPASQTINVGTGNGFTVETWINPFNLTNQSPLFEWNTGDGTAWGVHFYLSLDAGPGSFYANLVDSGGNWHQIHTSVAPVVTNMFQHAALTYDKASGTATIYYNGTIVAQQDLGSFTPLTSYNLFLGRRPPTGGQSFNYSGLMDEPAVYNRALAQSEIQAIYNAGSAGKCTSATISSGPPAIFNFSPASGSPGSVVAIVGTNFSTTAASNIVYFGAVRANIVSASPTSLIVTVPTGATYAPITVSVGGLIAYAGKPFLVTFAGSGSVTLAPRLDLPAVNGVGQVAFADLDGDGKADLVVASGDQGLSIYQNISTNGMVTAASFAPPVNIPLPAGLDVMTVADVDGDGKLDVLFLNRNSNQVVILKNISTPGLLTTNSFAAPVAFPTGNDPRGVAVQDLDGDGKPEIIVGNWGDSTVSVFHNTGAADLTTNSFSAAVTFAVGSYPQGLAVADLDGDGLPDIVTADTANFAGDGSQSVSVLRNLSTLGNIAFATRIDYPGLPASYNLAIGDLDGDGKLDLVVSSFNLGQAVSVYRNTSTPGSLTTNSFAPHVDFSVGGWGNAVAIGDLDGDGKPDLAVVTQLPDHLSVFKNVSTPGSFTTSSLAARVDYPTGWNPNGVAIGDLDGDGRPDIAFAVSYGATLSFYQNLTGPATITPTTNPPVILAIVPPDATNGATLSIAGNNFSAVTAGNIVYFGAVRANVLSANPTNLIVTVPTGATFGPITVTIGGLTAYSGQSFLPTFTGTGTNIDNSSFASSFNLPTGGNPQSCILADLDGDGKPDIALTSANGHCVTIFRNISTNGALLSAASFAPPVNLAFPANGTSGDPYRVRAADLDGDGKLDLIACEIYGNRVSVFHNVSSPGSLTASSFEPAFALISGGDCRFATAGDLDGDGRADIVALNYGDKTISIFKNIGTNGSLTAASFAPPVTLADAGGPYDAVIADLDGDGKLDLAVASADSGTTTIFQNAATSGVINANSFLPSFDLPTGNNTEVILAVDLDGDGKLDLVVGSAQSDDASVFRNVNAGGLLTANSFATRVDFGTPGWMHVISVADFNGDGKPDLAAVGELPSYLSIFQNASTPGSFTSSSFTPRVDFGTGWNAWGLAAGDLDGDGRPDVVFCNQYDSNVQIYQNVLPFGTPPSCTPPLAGTVAWWKAQMNAADSFGDNNGTPAGGTSYAPGLVGTAFQFTGSTSMVALGDPADLRFTNAFSIEGWVNVQALPGPAGYNLGQILFRGDTRTYFDPYFLCVLNTGAFRFHLEDATAAGVNLDTAPFSTNQWLHLAATFDGATGLMRIFVNGQLAAQTTTSIRPFQNLDPNYNPGVAIGNTEDGIEPFFGLIDELTIYARAISSNEVASIYSAGSAGKCSDLIAPFITAQPTNQTVTVNNPVTFAVTAGGTQTLLYQWNFNGTNIFGATNTALTLNNVQPWQAGNYFVTVSNLLGSAVSSNAVLTVYVPPAPPTILAQTPNQFALLGSAVTFSVTAGGSTPLSYFWNRNGKPIPGATNASYTLFNAQLSDSGAKFNCLVTNFYGFAASTNAMLKVLNTLANDLCSGAIIVTNASYTNLQSTLKASSFGDPTPDCIYGFGHGVWYEFTAPVAGLLVVDTFGSDFDTGLALYTGACGALTEVACDDDTDGVTSQVTVPTTAGTTYFILVGGYASDAGNLVLHLNHLTPPAFDVQPTNISVVVSSNAIFNPTVSGSLPMSFQWYFNNLPLADGGRISGSTNSVLNIASVLTNDGGNYFLVASNIVGVTTSSVAVLTPIILPPVFLQTPVSQSVIAGANANFFAVVDGTPPYSYQWYFNGNALADDGIHLAGSLTSSLNISNLTTADAGSYSLIVTNVSGSINAAATLTVLVPPVITAQPIGRSVPPGLPTTFTVTASGIPTPVYQWQLNSTNLPGVSSIPSWTVPAIGTNNLGFYQVIASNLVGTATSAVAQLTFGPVAAWGRNLNNECLPPPGLSNVIGLAGTYQDSFAVRADGTIAAWGNSARTNIPASATNVISLFTDGNAGFTALRANGTLAMWGVSAPTVLSNVVSVAMGFYANFALRAEGTVVGWGNLPYSTVPAGLNHVTAIAAGYSHALALRNDGSIVAWGTGAATNMPAGLSNVIAIAAGATHSLALKANGSVVAWGAGTGTNLPAGLTNIIAISCSTYVQTPNLCLALRSNGTVVAWGDNPYGETNPPAALSNLLSVAIAAAPNHGLALVNDGRPQILQPPVGLNANLGRDVTLQARAVGAAPLSYQWLLNGTNVVGATNASLLIPVIQSASTGNYQLFVSNSVGTAISLQAFVNVISNNTLTFLSQATNSITNYQGSKITIGSVAVQGNGPLRYQWFSSPTNKNYAAVSGATNDTLGLDPALAWQSGNYYLAVSNLVGGITSAPVSVKILFARAWGYNAVSNPPVNVTNAIAVATGGATGNNFGHYLALGADGKVTAWANYSPIYGETSVSALSNSFVTAIAAGYEHSLALKSDGTVYAWGYNAYGQTNVPANLNSVVAIACGGYHDLALKADGTVVGWGDTLQAPIYGQATNNPAATNVVAIAAGNLHSLALRADGSVVAWGYTGDGTTTIPAAASNVVGIAAGSGLSVALRANGTVVEWGNGILKYPVPVSLNNLSNVVAISASGAHCTALRNDGSVVSWGSAYSDLASNYVPADLAYVAAIASGGDHDIALFGTRAPAFTIQPWSRTVTNFALGVWFAGKCAGVQPVSYQWRLNGTNIPAATNDTLALGGRAVTGAPLALASGVYQLIASNAYGVAISKPAKLSVIIPLPEAVDATSLAWSTSGNATWYGQTNYTHDGIDAARSGGIGPLQETILQTTLTTNVAGNATFWWKVSSEQFFDTLEFRVNGTVQSVISGEVDWQKVSVPLAPGTNVLLWRYSKDVSFDAGLDAGFVDQFAFAPAPNITRQPSSLANYQGTTASFSVSATGASPLIYQWRKNGTNLASTANIAGVTTSSLTLSAIDYPDAGSYAVVITNVAGSVTSSPALLTVLDGRPSIVSSPASQTNNASTTVSFQVIASGTPPLNYQWLKNGTPLSEGGNAAGTTSASLTLTDVQAADSAAYLVVVTNNYGSVTSAPALLTVLDVAPTIVTQPANHSRMAGQSASFSATATGTTPLSYQWLFNGANLPGATNATLVLSNISQSNAGPYRVVVTNKMGSASSAIATLSLTHSMIVAWGDNTFGQTNVPDPLPEVTAISAGWRHTLALDRDGTVSGWGYNGDCPVGAPAGLSNVVAVSAGGGWGLALKSDGSVVGMQCAGIDASTNWQVSGLSNITQVAAGWYHWLALKSDGSLVTWSTANDSYTPTNIPAGLTNVTAIAAGDEYSVALKADGTVVAWGWNDYGQTNVPTGLSNVIAIAASSVADHTLALKNDGTVVAWGLDYSGQVEVPIGLSNVVAIAVGQQHSLALKADGTVVAWGTNAYYTVDPGMTQIPTGLSNVIAIGAGEGHSVALVNDGSPAILRQPANQTVSSNTAVHFSVTALGAPPLAYQWKKNGANLTDGGNLSGTGAASLTVGNAQSADMAIYTVVITNAVGSITSAPAALVVVGPPALALQPVSQTVNLGTVVQFSAMAVGFPTPIYQWWWNGTNQVGGNSPWLVLNNVARTQAGTYSVTVTNSAGAAVSSNAVLKVFAPQQLGTPRLLPNGSLQLTSSDGNGGTLSPTDLPNFEAQASADLVNWVTLPNALSLTNGLLQLSDPARTSYPVRYYRLIEH